MVGVTRKLPLLGAPAVGVWASGPNPDK
jgi:hypothetical protein